MLEETNKFYDLPIRGWCWRLDWGYCMLCPFRNGELGLNSLCYIYFYNKTSLSIQNVNRSNITPYKAMPKNLLLKVPSTKIMSKTLQFLLLLNMLRSTYSCTVLVVIMLWSNENIGKEDKCKKRDKKQLMMQVEAIWCCSGEYQATWKVQLTPHLNVINKFP